VDLWSRNESDLMLHGILRMPLEMAMGDKISQYQFYQTAQQALDRMVIAEEERDKWKTEAEKLFEESLDDALDALVGEINKDTLDWAQSQIDVLRNRVSELTKALELAHQHGSFEQGSGVLHTINDVLYGDQK